MISFRILEWNQRHSMTLGDIWLQVQTFYNGLNHAIRQMIDATVRGTLNNKTPEVAQELSEEMAMNNCKWNSSQAKPSKPTNVYDVDTVTTLTIQVEALSKKKIDGLSFIKQPTQLMQCDLCGGG